ncbi:MAG TPA: murein biosynthesis integral membrane protein MurJ [Terracidiphilus sp.]|nr:murein biosynthesis integral membrane protein MurJ [Terracidiphilus sp.]
MTTPQSTPPGSTSGSPAASWLQRVLRSLRPTHTHSVFSATVVLMASVFLSRIIGLVRNTYVAWLFGRGMQADALNAAFALPDMILYFLVGGAASITFVTILTQYRDTGREAEGNRSLSVILTTMYLILGVAILIAELLAPVYVHHMFPGFSAQTADLCIILTRILLPQPLFIFAGGVFGAVLLVRKQFTIQAVTPLVYNLGTIFGGVLLVKHLGASSLALGTVAGAFLGPFFLNWYFARRAGTRYTPILDWHDEGLRQWVRMSLPLIIGVSLVSADNWIIQHFASNFQGGVTLMTYAKVLFTAPMAMLGQAAGSASMPFFASLWSQNRRFEFANSVADSVSRVACLGLLAASAIVPFGIQLVSLIFVHGRFHAADAIPCAAYFAVFSLSLFLWCAQAIYARAFYAAGDTFTPMAASTVVTLVSLPIYAALFHTFGGMGLAVASDIGIALQTLTIALLLHQRHMVSLASLDFREFGRCLLAALTGAGLLWLIFSVIGGYLARHYAAQLPRPSHWTDLAVLVAGSLLWLLVTDRILMRTGSALPRVARKRLGLA